MQNDKILTKNAHDRIVFEKIKRSRITGRKKLAKKILLTKEKPVVKNKPASS